VLCASSLGAADAPVARGRHPEDRVVGLSHAVQPAAAPPRLQIVLFDLSEIAAYKVDVEMMHAPSGRVFFVDIREVSVDASNSSRLDLSVDLPWGLEGAHDISVHVWDMYGGLSTDEALLAKATIPFDVLPAVARHVLEVVPPNSAEAGASFVHNPRATLASLHAPRATPIFVHDLDECAFISRRIRHLGHFESDLQEMLLTAMEQAETPAGKKSVFVDIGANLGAYSLVVAAAGFHVVAFEPMHYNTELLAASIAKAGKHSSVRLFKAAVAQQGSGVGCMQAAGLGHPGDNFGNGQLHPPDNASGACQPGQEEVPIVSLDDVLLETPSLSDMCVGAVKVDVEGYENFALRGASLIMRGSCPPCMVVVEFFRQYTQRASRLQGYAPGAEGSDVFELLVQELGYTCTPVRNTFVKGPQAPAAPPFSTAPDADYVCLLPQHPRCRRVVLPEEMRPREEEVPV